MRLCCRGKGRGPYRERNGFMLGVCQGLADYLGLPAWVVRAFAVLLFVVLGWPVLAVYLGCGLLFRPEPEARRSASASGPSLHVAARELVDRAARLDERLARMESHVTSREFDFDRRLDRP